MPTDTDMSGGRDSAVRAFFGGNASAALSLPPPRRGLRPGVWSSTAAEEDAWVDALLRRSSAAAGEGPRAAPGSDASVASPPRFAAPHAPMDDAEAMPRLLHFVWLGGGPLPTFPFLGGEAPGDDVRAGDGAGRRRSAADEGGWNECLRSWKRHHPSSRGWTIHLWTERDIVEEASPPSSAFGMGAASLRNARGYRQAMKSENFGMASDILRLEILHRFGGVYADVDYWCVASLDDVLRPPVQFFCGASNAGCVELNNGLLGCRRGGHPILRRMMESIGDRFGTEGATPSSSPPPWQARNDATTTLLSSFLDAAAVDALATARRGAARASTPMDAIEHTGPGLLTRAACRWLVAAETSARAAAAAGALDRDADHPPSSDAATMAPSQTVRVFPARAFHPFPNHLRGRLACPSSSGEASPAPRRMLEAFVDRDTIAVHLWGCSWQTPSRRPPHETVEADTSEPT